jgi:hypothetical protein
MSEFFGRWDYGTVADDGTGAEDGRGVQKWTMATQEGSAVIGRVSAIVTVCCGGKCSLISQEHGRKGASAV